MKTKLISVVVLLLTSSVCWAYGGGGGSSSKACAKPKFSELMPVEHAEVAAGSAFSFTASANTVPESIKVMVKGFAAGITVKPKKNGEFEVVGTLPASLTSTYARIAIEADAANSCHGTEGWLVKINH